VPKKSRSTMCDISAFKAGTSTRKINLWQGALQRAVIVA
jgi:hypothetical protein